MISKGFPTGRGGGAGSGGTVGAGGRGGGTSGAADVAAVGAVAEGIVAARLVAVCSMPPGGVEGGGAKRAPPPEDVLVALCARRADIAASVFTNSVAFENLRLPSNADPHQFVPARGQVRQRRKRAAGSAAQQLENHAHEIARGVSRGDGGRRLRAFPELERADFHHRFSQRTADSESSIPRAAAASRPSQCTSN